MVVTYDAFFFDFDGVLADTMEIKTQAFAELFAPYGDDIRDRVVEHHRNHGGMTRIEKFRHYYKVFLKLPLDDKKLADLCDAFTRLVVDRVVAAPAIPGAEEFLQTCQGKVICFVISGTPEDEIIEIVRRRGWAKYFRRVCGAPTTKHDHLKMLLDRYSLYPAKCLFFGDAISDYNAAQACGVPFVGILPDKNAPLLRTAPDIRWVRDFKALQI